MTATDTTPTPAVAAAVAAAVANVASADVQLQALQLAQQIYHDEFTACPRSPEYKAGALRALRLKAGLAPAASPYESGSARDDAWLAGHQAGLTEWKWQASRAQGTQA